MKKVIIIGAGGHGKVIADIVRLNGDQVYGFIDDKVLDNFLGFPILGKLKDMESLIEKEYSFFVAVGENYLRQKILDSYSKINWYTAIHPSAIIASDVDIGMCTAIMANVVVNSGSKIGYGAIVNTAATVDHDCIIGDFVHISPGVHLAGNVHVGNNCWIGIGATVINNIQICDNSIIGAGAVVVDNIEQKGIYIGVPARRKT